MFLFTKPDPKAIKQFLDERAPDRFSYPEVGATQTVIPAGYNVDHNRIKIGTGGVDFERARSAVRSWKMFNMSWVNLISTETPIEIGQTVAVLISHFGFYSLNATRIVYTMDEPSKFGFAYGTLTEHGEIGEERFSVEYHEDSGEVWYDILAFSRPGSMFAKIGYPLTRYLQRAFANDSKAAMLRAVSGHPSR